MVPYPTFHTKTNVTEMNAICGLEHYSLSPWVIQYPYVPKNWTLSSLSTSAYIYYNCITCTRIVFPTYWLVQWNGMTYLWLICDYVLWLIYDCIIFLKADFASLEHLISQMLSNLVLESISTGGFLVAEPLSCFESHNCVRLTIHGVLELYQPFYLMVDRKAGQTHFIKSDIMIIPF